MRAVPGLCLCLLAALLSAATAQGDWKAGRATYYGVDGWSIHKGNCGLGYQYKNVGTGWDVAAIADASPEFAGSCGRCYEVRCDPRKVVDGYGNSFDRSGACKAGSASVVLRTVDSCPCNYPSNAYSNKRWCCGDNTGTQGTHFDMSIWAFEKLADVKQGVAAVQFRRVPCSYRPSNPAPAGPSPMPASESPSALGFTGTPFDPATDISQQKLVMRFDDNGKEQGAVRPMQHFDAGTGAAVVTMGDYMNKQGGSGFSSSSSASASASSTTTSDNGCTDTPPSGSTCQQQKANNQCSQNWMLSGNYCRATCGRCHMSGASSSASASSSSTTTSDNGCTDTQPSGTTCQQQKANNQCGQNWMLSGNYCRATCGRCQMSSGSSSASASASSSSSASSPSTSASASASSSSSSSSSNGNGNGSSGGSSSGGSGNSSNGSAGGQQQKQQQQQQQKHKQQQQQKQKQQTGYGDTKSGS